MINFDETDKLELKENYNDSIAKEIVAFLNTDGGTIIIGITKNKEVIGIEVDIDKLQREISDMITDQISPRCVEFVYSHKVVLDGKNIIQLEVKRGNKLFYIKKYGLSERGCYVRIGSTCKSLTPDEIMRKYEENMPKPSIEEMTSRTQNLTFRIFRIYLDEKKITYDSDHFFETFKLLNNDGQFNELAYLLSDQFDESIKVCRFKGDGGNLVMRKEFGNGCIFKIYHDVINYMQSQENIVKTYFDHGQRRDEYLYDEVAFVEAWKNAILHNDYAVRQYPQIYLYDDRLEVMSHGYPLKYDTLDEFIRGVSNPINLQLAKIAMNLDITDQTGKGNKDIVRIYGKDVFDIMAHTLIVNIPYNDLALSRIENVPQNVPQNVPLRSDIEMIIDAIKQNPTITRQQLAIVINKSYKTVARIIKKHGNIKYVGPSKGGHWEIKE